MMTLLIVIDYVPEATTVWKQENLMA